MSLGTIDRTPPPFFRQGHSALTKLAFFSALALFLMVADLRLKVTQPVRSVLATALVPLQRALVVPVDFFHRAGQYLQTLESAVAAQDTARAQLARQAQRAAQVEQLTRENDRLRALLDLQPALSVRSVAAEVMYDAPDVFSRKVFIGRGATHGVALGSPVINEAGVLGQVTRVYPLNAEVTLLVDKDAAIPVINARSQARSAAFGGAGGGNAMELRFMAADADVQVGDLLTTGGMDGVYPSGLPVAKVQAVERRAESGFARIVLAPSAVADNVRHVLVLQPLSVQLPPRPEPAPEADKPGRGAKGGPRR